MRRFNQIRRFNLGKVRLAQGRARPGRSVGKVIAFLQLYNELSAGNLIRCLENCKSWAEEIFIYDDASTDGSYEVYLKYTDAKHIIVGGKTAFTEELFHKEQLLKLALKSNPTWIGWIDGDTILSRWVVENYREFLPQFAVAGYDGVRIHNMNLWRHPAFYRLDNLFDGLWHCVFWRNNGQLHYRPQAGLHQNQYPHGMGRKVQLHPNQVLIHYGFASEAAVAKKYLVYKSHGQQGWELDRLIDEQSSFQLAKVPKDSYPLINVPEDYDTAACPTPITFNQYRQFDSWESYIASNV